MTREELDAEIERMKAREREIMDAPTKANEGERWSYFRRRLQDDFGRHPNASNDAFYACLDSWAAYIAQLHTGANPVAETPDQPVRIEGWAVTWEDGGSFWTTKPPDVADRATLLIHKESPAAMAPVEEMTRGSLQDVCSLGLSTPKAAGDGEVGYVSEAALYAISDPERPFTNAILKRKPDGPINIPLYRRAPSGEPEGGV